MAVLTEPPPRADMAMSPGLVSSARSPIATVALSCTVLTTDSALAPLSAPPVLKVTLSVAVIRLSARRANAPAVASVPVTVSFASAPTSTFVSNDTVVTLEALAPDTRPPVVPLMFSLSSTGFVTVLWASATIEAACTSAFAATAAVTAVVTVFRTSAPAPASRPPLTARTRPLTWAVEPALTVSPPVSVTFAASPSPAVTPPVCSVTAVAEAPAATPPPPA